MKCTMAALWAAVVAGTASAQSTKNDLAPPPSRIDDFSHIIWHHRHRDCCARLCHAQTSSTDSAQAYPSKSVRIIVPFAPSGPNDVIACIVGQKLGELWGHTFLVENRGWRWWHYRCRCGGQVRARWLHADHGRLEQPCSCTQPVCQVAVRSAARYCTGSQLRLCAVQAYRACGDRHDRRTDRHDGGGFIGCCTTREIRQAAHDRHGGQQAHARRAGVADSGGIRLPRLRG